MAPLDSQFPQQIINVHWGGGGRFISGDRSGIVRYAKIDRKTNIQTWTAQELSFPQGGSGAGEITAGSYALAEQADNPGNFIPTFVLGGHGYPVPATEENQAYAVIFASHNGTNWTKVFSRSEPRTIIGVDAMVWDQDKKAFFANVVFFERDIALTTETVFRSNDGLTWVEGAGSFDSHCKGQLADKPDGFYGYDQGNDILIYPMADASGVTIRTTNAEGKYETSDVVMIDIMLVTCVAFAEGIWEAGGENEGKSATATSIDDGRTWKIVTSGALIHEETGVAPAITVILGAPKPDFGS